MSDMINMERNALGDFLRSRRKRLSPEAVGLKGGPRRRTPGLRREEVAELAGIGVDWYVRLEQGRGMRPSSATVDAIARVMRLNQLEHAHLRKLALRDQRHSFAFETVPDTLKQIVAALNQPAYVTGRRLDILFWNTAAVDVFGDFEDLDPEDRNILLYVLTDPGARRLFGDSWAEEASRMTAQFRATHDFWVGDQAFEDLLSRLRIGSPEFNTWWAGHEIKNTPTGQKVLHHPTRGTLRFEFATFQANCDPALRLAIYSPISRPE